MSKTNGAMVTVKTGYELMNGIINKSGKMVDFEKLSKKQQKEIVLKRALKARNKMLEAYENINSAIVTKKKIQKAIKELELTKKRNAQVQIISDNVKLIDTLRKQLEEMAATAGDLGIDVIADIDKLQLIEGGNYDGREN